MSERVQLSPSDSCRRDAAAADGPRPDDGGPSGARNNSMPFQGLEQAGPGSLKHSGKTAAEAIKDAQRKFADADPRVRVQGLEELRFVDSDDANEILFEEFPIPTCACALRPSMCSARAGSRTRFQ